MYAFQHPHRLFERSIMSGVLSCKYYPVVINEMFTCIWRQALYSSYRRNTVAQGSRDAGKVPFSLWSSHFSICEQKVPVKS